jgi:uroporphyrinogen-III synthase
MLSSGEALLHLFGTLPGDAVAALREARVVAASPRLAELAREQGFATIVVADSARPAALLDAAARASSAARKHR